MRQKLTGGFVGVVVPAALPVGLLLSGAISESTTPLRSALFLTAIAWGLVAIHLAIQTRSHWFFSDGRTRMRKLCWLTGLVFALAQICERVAADEEGVWWTRSLLPVFTHMILRSGIDFLSPRIDLDNSTTPVQEAGGSGRLILIVTGTSAAVLSTAFTRSEVTLLGLSSTLLISFGLILLENILIAAPEKGGRSSTGGASGGIARRYLSIWNDEVKTAVRDTTAAFAIVCLVASFVFEKNWPSSWGSQLFLSHLSRSAAAVFIETARCIFTVEVARRYSVFHVSILILGSVLISKLCLAGTAWNFYLCALYVACSAQLLNASWGTSKARMRVKQISTLLGAFSLVVLLGKIYQNHTPTQHVTPSTPEIFSFPVETPTELLGPLKIGNTATHPIDQLIISSQSQFNHQLEKQSKTLEAAVKEYRRRYGIPPPPKFDIWFEFAKRKNVQLIDEFDTIHHSLLPFWGLEPAVIRKRVTEALGFGDNFLMGVLIRNGEVTHVENGADWQQEATVGMMASFIKYLPDMDLAFNMHDEPRVILPHDLLSRLVHVAKTQKMPLANRHQEPSNQFSPRSSDLTEGKHIADVKYTRFNRFAHQPTWTHSRLSCPPDSPARALDDSPQDNITSYAYGDLGFVYNHTAFSDICVSPSLRHTFGFFDRPNAFNIVQDLMPVFSQSKIGSFQDILYPSPWYWAGKVEYQEKRDMAWSEKEGKLYWRGSTTGGFSRQGGWRRQHRQRVVRKINAPDTARILKNAGTDISPNWQPQDVQRRDYSEIIDVAFSHVGQCDDDDCNAQREFFAVTDRVDQQDAWRYRYLLDIDGNAFSGRFYAFLRSNSLVFKMSLFQEWHMEWLKPWTHYIPVSLIGDDWLEAVRFFSGEEKGKTQGPAMAKTGQEWASKALRNEDIEVWFFRLLLEYGRVVDDNRERIGFGGP